MLRSGTIAALAVTAASGAFAQTTDGVVQASFVYNGEERTITQSSTLDAALIARFYKLPDTCAGLCVAPQHAASGVTTISELQVIDFLTTAVSAGDGLLIDARTPTDRVAGYLPASVSVPHILINESNDLLPEILIAMGARSFEGALNFSDAMPIVVFDAGPTTNDAPTFINALIQAGYPAAKISYYRGGMQSWSALGLTIEGSPS